MDGPEVKLRCSCEGVVHWLYPMAGALTVCGLLLYESFDAPCTAPTCIRCIALVQTGQQGDGMPWVPPDPMRRQG